MNCRTDLAIERLENKITAPLFKDTETINGVQIDTIFEDGKHHITLTLPNLAFHGEEKGYENIVANKLSELLPKKIDSILVCGLGNRDITPDAVGPLTASRVLATRHISNGLKKELNLESLRSAAVISPDVLGKTGIETAEIIKSVAAAIKPSALIVIDALCARDIKRLGTTIQISDAGISPGSGVKNSRKEISEKNLNVPVIAVGIPTVIDAASLINSNEPFIVTSRDIDILIDRASTLLSRALNIALQPDIDPEILNALV